MKATYAGLTSAVPLDTINDYLYNCNRKPYEIPFFIPVVDGSDVQVYIDFGTVRPLAFTSTLISLCDATTVTSLPCQYVFGVTPANTYYGVFRFASGTTLPAMFAIAIDVSMNVGSDRRYFTQGYQVETCLEVTKVEACFPELSSSLGYDTNDIYFGYTTNNSGSRGNLAMRYLHFVNIRNAKVFEDAPKITFSSNIRQNFKTVLNRVYELRTERVPAWYKEYLLAVYARGYIQVSDTIYQVSDLALEGIDDDDHTWLPYAKLKKETRYYFGCDSTPCSSDCCSPCDVAATVAVIIDPCCSPDPDTVSATVEVMQVYISNLSSCSEGDNFTSFKINGPVGAVVAMRVVLAGFFSYDDVPGSPSNITVSGSITLPAGATSDNNPVQVFPFTGQTGNQPINKQSDLPFEVTIPSGGQVTINALANIENGGTAPFFAAGVRIISIDGTEENIYQAICTGYSTGG